MSSPFLLLKSVSFYYDKGKPTEVQALKEIFLDIKEGEYIAFFGPSGCGKSTLLYLISGIDKSTEGEVVVMGKNLSAMSSNQLVEYRQTQVGFIFQNFNLIPSLNAFRNVTLPLTLRGVSKNEREKRALEIMSRLSISELTKRYPYELSGGQQQRVGIARALANNPSLILADEPLGNLDSDNAKKVLDLLLELNKKDKKTVIMVTHEAWSLRDVDKIFYMKDGEVVKVEEKRKKSANEYQEAVRAYSVLHPESSALEIHAKAIAHLLLRGYSQEEIHRLEYFINQLFFQKININQFYQAIDRPFKEGGVGLWKQKARKISETIGKIITREKITRKIIENLNLNPETPLAGEIEHLRRILLEEVKVKLNHQQCLLLDEIIKQRIKSVISHDELLKLLNTPVKRGGLGLRLRTAFNLAESLELLLERPVENYHRL